MAKFEKNDIRINRSGRKPGSKNLNTVSLQKRIHGYLTDNWPRFEEAMNQLEPKDYVSTFEKLIRYRLPQMKEQQIRFDQMTDETINAVVDQILNSTDE